MNAPVAARRSLRWVAIVTALVAVFAGCRTIPVPAADQEPAAHITANPTLFPAFRRAISDYVVRCNASQTVAVNVDAPSGTTVSVDGRTARGGSFTANVTRDPGQRFVIAVADSSGTTRHSVRCLPSDFPAWSAQHLGDTQAEFYVTTANVGITGTSYPAVFDTEGVPIWWGPKTARFYAFPLDQSIVWNVGAAFEQHRFDGSLVRTYSTVGEPLDFHDLVLLPNGDHLVVSTSRKSGVDLSSWGGPTNATITDHVVQEVTPGGAVAWSWRTSDHIGVNETTAAFRAAELADPGGVFGNDYDPYHWNSIDWTDDGVVLSFRHLDAVYKIDKATGAIAWKLGGTQRPQSLSVVGDPVFEPGGGGGFGGQHDARYYRGTLTLYDDGTGRSRPPRAVKYTIDLAHRTATLVRAIDDPGEPTAFCCGSVRPLFSGHYIIGWGGNQDGSADFTETNRLGTRRFALSFTDPQAVIYRVVPILPDLVSRDALRAGMDAQYGT